MTNNFKYISDFLCTYKSYNEEDLSNTCYQIQLLQAFDLKEYNHEKLSNAIDNLYEKLRDNKQFQNIISNLSKNMDISHFLQSNNINLDEKYLLQFLLSYQYFDIFHKCLTKFFSNNSLENNNYFDEILEYIQKNKI